MGRFTGGALASFEATRFATGRKNAMRLEVNGSDGSLAFDFEAMNELSFYDDTEDPRTAGFRRILVTEPEHPYAGAWWPPGHLLGYEHTFTHEVRDFLAAIAAGHRPGAVVRRRPAGAARARRGRAAARPTAASGPTSDLAIGGHHAATDHPVHRPVGRPAVRGGLPARLRLGLRRPGDRLLGRPLRGRPGPRRRRLRPGQAGPAGEARPEGLGDLQPPGRPGRLRRPHRRAAQGHPARRGSGATATPRAYAGGPPRR